VKSELKIGSLINDGGSIGVITNVIEQGKWTEGGPFVLTRNYEIRYSDGQVTVMSEHSMSRLIEKGIVDVLSY